ncbi:transposase [Halogeometricum borinquense]|uniref:Transposase n=1 Tax=Halogeometricum borinquense TaxID=60847 RepID=A0A482TBQ2_9EURY|nr:zinc ribbon domain-containing protein [Halogeometricum borinquense]RYJ14327.1 transposase [Halogeometricum borinquense]
MVQRRNIDITGMSCPGCERTVETALKSVDGVRRADANRESGTVEIVVEDDVGDDDLGDAIHSAGYKIARQIVEDAEERNAVIVVGDLGGIRKDNHKGRYVNDKTHKMPFARLLNYIEYKAHDAGIDVRLVEEYDTSKTCNRCACEGVRETQGRFECPECGLDDNADKNGALNIGKRALGKFSKPLSEAGAILAQPETQVIVPRDDEPANLSVSVGSTPSGGTPRL